MILNLKLLPNGGDHWNELKQYLREGYNVESIKKAFDFASLAHENQKRESGEPYISHPAWIAKVIAQLSVGEEAVIAALLHDCVEDTSITINDIANNFGDEIALLVEGLTEVKRKTEGIEVHNTSIDIFRKFLFSSVNDVRILIIRLVDKLHNGFTIDALPEERQIKYARRIFGIYGPVAEYVGLHYFKKLLEDIAFKILYPKEAKELAEFLTQQSKEEEIALNSVTQEVEAMLKINNLHDCEIQGRVKGLYSSYVKIKNKGQDKLKDGVGIRIITNNVANCYTILGLLHSRFEYIPEAFDDYISNPKPNGYRSIQTTLTWENKLTVEVQIRTKEMHEFNEFGPASHIAYKLSKDADGPMGYEWVRDLIKWQKSDDNIKNYTIKVLEKFIYVFTPKGDTIQLPAGSTALDFAYRLHTDIGDHCLGAKINQKMTKIDTVLNTGDYVEILMGNKVNVNINWLQFVTTANAKEHIRKKTSELV